MTTYTEQEVKFQSEFELAGTLAIPNGIGNSLPAILFLPGSGQIDRNGNVTKGKFKFNIYRELAQKCTELGFITLRYDKRGLGESSGDLLSAGLWDAVKDAESAIDFLKSHPFVDSEKIIIIGHSEGCMVGTAVCARTNVSGFVMLAGAAETMREALDGQRKLLFKELEESKGLQGFIVRTFKTARLAEKQAQKVYQKVFNTDKDTIRTSFVKLPAKYFREHLSYDVLEDLAKITCPILAIGGGKDFQAHVEYLERIPVIVKGAHECYVISDMDHGLKRFDKPISPTTYKKDYLASIDKPIHEELLLHLFEWLKKHY